MAQQKTLCRASTLLITTHILQPRAQHVSIKDVSVLVVDEADLLFSFGYEQDVRALLNHMGPIFQSFLMSATMTNVCLVSLAKPEDFESCW